MSASYYKIITDLIETGDIKKAYTLFRGFEATGQFSEEEMESLEKKFDDPSLSRQTVINALAKIRRFDPELRMEIDRLDEKSWRRFRIDFNIAVFGEPE